MQSPQHLQRPRSATPMHAFEPPRSVLEFCRMVARPQGKGKAVSDKSTQAVHSIVTFPRIGLRFMRATGEVNGDASDQAVRGGVDGGAHAVVRKSRAGRHLSVA